MADKKEQVEASELFNPDGDDNIQNRTIIKGNVT